MGILRLSPDRLVARDSEGETEVRPASVWDLLPYLFHSVEVDPTFKLGDLFRVVDCEDSGLLAAILAEDIGPLLEEARTGARPDADESLEFVQVCNRHDNGHLHRDFEGWGAWDEPYEGAWTEQPSAPREGGIAVEFAPVTELLDLPLRYNPELVLRGSEYEVEYRTEIDITFAEFVKAVFFELTFLGSPRERDAARAELETLTARIERGEERLIPDEEVYRELRLAPDEDLDDPT
jgi:hypothetical protein